MYQRKPGRKYSLHRRGQLTLLRSPIVLTQFLGMEIHFHQLPVEALKQICLKVKKKWSFTNYLRKTWGGREEKGGRWASCCPWPPWPQCRAEQILTPCCWNSCVLRELFLPVSFSCFHWLCFHPRSEQSKWEKHPAKMHMDTSLRVATFHRDIIQLFHS